MRTMVLVCLLLSVAGPAAGTDRIRVTTTLPGLADWAREIGGERVEVRSLLNGLENPHTYEPTISDVKRIAGSRVLIRVGLGLEEWLDGAIENARNIELIVVDASRGVSVIDDGGGHAGEHRGNPHVWLDPDNAVIMCRNIAWALEEADPFPGEYYQNRFEAYARRIRTTARAIRERVARLPDKRFLAYHGAWPYFARALGFEVAGVVTGRPGQEPSARSLARLVDRIRTEHLRVLVTEPQLSSKIPEVLAEETGIRVVELSPLLGTGDAATYLGLLESNAATLIAALAEGGR